VTTEGNTRPHRGGLSAQREGVNFTFHFKRSGGGVPVRRINYDCCDYNDPRVKIENLPEA
jgi:hypothetical protein